MATTILTSCLNIWDKDENDVRYPHVMGNENGVLDTLKRHIKKYDNFLFVASVADAPEITDIYAKATIEAIDMTMHFKKYSVLDGRNSKDAKQLIDEADFIVLTGGHVPTQNKFFAEFGLFELLKNSQAVVLGISAGTMNLAETVYSPPELDGEYLDENFRRFFGGVGRTNINVFPHYDELYDSYLDGVHVMTKIVEPDSFKIPVLCMNNGTYVEIVDDVATLYGEAYLMKNGKMEQICNNDQSIDVTYLHLGK